jgi:RNA-directed DNA polymerase
MPTVDMSALNKSALLFMYLDVLPRDATHCMLNMEKHVKETVITTNHGKKKRTIFAPSPDLKWVQNRIRHGLLLSMPVEDCVHGFRRERGIVTNATGHAGQRMSWVLNVDLKDFFPTINFPRVFGFFRTCFGFEDKVAGDLARLTTHANHLCQGFPTSPDIANFIAWKIDRRVMAMAEKRGVTYTRYADDLTFGSPEGGKATAQNILRAVRNIVETEGFTVNESKIAIMRMGRRKKVTGLVIGDNGTVNLPRKTRRLLRAAVHHWPQQTPERKAAIRGWISYLQGVDPVTSARLLADIALSEVNAVDREWNKNVSHQPFTFDISPPPKDPNIIIIKES